AGAVEERHRAGLSVIEPVVLGLHVAADIALDIAAGENPFLAQRREAGPDVDRDAGIGIGTRGIVSADRLFPRARLEIDLAHRHLDVGMLLAGDEHFARGRQGAGRDFEALADSAFGHDDLLPGARAIRPGFPARRWRAMQSAVPVPTPVRSGSGSKGSRRLLPRLVSAPVSGLPLETRLVWIVTVRRQALSFRHRLARLAARVGGRTRWE